VGGREVAADGEADKEQRADRGGYREHEHDEDLIADLHERRGPGFGEVHRRRRRVHAQIVAHGACEEHGRLHNQRRPAAILAASDVMSWPSKRNRPRRRLLQAIQTAQERGLSRSGLAHQS
jgi:hypothetical protein